MCFQTSFVIFKVIFKCISRTENLQLASKCSFEHYYMNLILSERSSTLPLLVPMLSSISRDGVHYSTSAEDVTIGNLIMTLDSLRFIVASGKFARSLNSNMRFGASIQLVARSRKRGGQRKKKKKRRLQKKKQKKKSRGEKGSYLAEPFRV